MNDRLKKQIDFILEIDKEKEIIRQTYLADGSRKENDAEHAFHMAVMVMLLSEYANEKIDVLHAMKMALVHDLVEIDAGDTYAYDAAGQETKEERELAAADRIFGLLPDDQARKCRMLWDEFEAKETPEARFVNTLDRVQPVLLTDNANGKSWREHGVKKSWIKKRNENTHLGSEELSEYVMKLIEENVAKGNIKDE